METVSIIIPTYKEPYLNKTIDSVLENAKGDIEIIVVIDGDALTEEIRKNEKIRVVCLNKHSGMREAINKGIDYSRGKYIMKLDAHCIVAKGFDEILKRDCKENWLMIPRRYPLNADAWARGTGSPIKDYHYISSPILDKNGYRMTPQFWEKTNDKKIDDVMTMQGSCWFAHKKYFRETIGKLDTRRYGGFAGDQLEIGMKYWTRGGRMKVNKNTWYAHLYKNENYYNKHKALSRQYKIDRTAFVGFDRACRDWFEDVTLLVAKFWPVPSWSKDKLWKMP